MLYRFVMSLTIGLVGLCVGIGCAPQQPSYVEPKELAAGEAAVLTRPKNTTVYIVKIDGGVTPRPSPRFADLFNGERILLRPGIHTVEVRYEEGNRFSLYNAELSFAAEAGHTYEVSDWPPDLLDITESRKNAKPVPHQLRVVKPPK